MLVAITAYGFSLLLLPITAYASKLGVRVTSGFWGTIYNGFVLDKNNINENVNLKDDLNLGNSVQSFFYIYLEQSNPYIPNFRLGQSRIRSNGNNKLNRTFTYQDTIYTANENISSTFSLDHIETSFYWKVINNDHKMDLGLTIKDFAGQVSISGEIAGTATESLDAIIPLIYIGYETDLPLTAYTVGVTSSFLGINNKTYLYDVMAYIRYQTYTYVGVEVGFRQFQIKANNSEINMDITISGIYLNGFISF